jgi:hypothetical protein
MLEFGGAAAFSLAQQSGVLTWTLQLEDGTATLAGTILRK